MRAAWEALVAGDLDTGRLVFVYEIGSNTALSPLYAWARRGRRAYAKAPRNCGKNMTLLSSMSAGGMGPGLAVVGSATKTVFETYVERVLAPALSPGQVVVMDNLAAHKGERVRELVGERGCELLFLPPCSPDLNPIEEAFSMVKGLLRKAGVRRREALIEAMRRALNAVTSRDARSSFGHYGYRLCDR